MRIEDGTRVLATPSVLWSENSAVAAIDGGDKGILTIRQDGWDSDEDGTNRKNWIWKVYDQNHDEVGWGDDLRSPEYHDALQSMQALISFLVACAESKSEESENYTLFPTPVREWAEMNSDELTMIELEIADEIEDM